MEVEKWFCMSASFQILNIGGEVQRAVDWKGKDMVKANNFLNKALEWINLSIEDPKNINRREEFTILKEELIDFFNENKFQNDSSSIMDYWNSYFTAICR